jgi:hypothetical protein
VIWNIHFSSTYNSYFNVQLYSSNRFNLNKLYLFDESACFSCALIYVHSKKSKIQLHYLFIGIAYFFKGKAKIERLYDHGRRLVLYGIACMIYENIALLSINFLNYGIYHAVLAWLTLICVLILHAMALIV